MKILFIASFKATSKINDGYLYATQSIKTILENLKTNKTIKHITYCDFSEIHSIQKDEYDYCFLIANPNSIKNAINIFTNLFAMCKKKYLHILWETSPLPVSWKWLWDSDIFDGFFTPSRFFKELIERETKKPVFYTPYYVEVSNKPIDIELKKNEDKFTILFIGQVTRRKGIEDAITAYVRTFNLFKNNTQLILKCFRLSKYEDDIEDIISSICHQNTLSTENLKIFVLDENLSKQEIFDLYSKSSILLMPSRGEGFALPPAEAMSIGIPVIYTNWSNLPEVCNPDRLTTFDPKVIANCPIGYTLDEAVNMIQYNYEIGTKYAIPLMDDLMKALYFKYIQWNTDKENYYKQASQNIELIKRYFNLDVCSKYYEEIFITNK